MKLAWTTYWKKPQSKLAIIVALMAQLIFCIFWMTAYDGVLDRTDRLSIATVNEDGEAGQKLEERLKSSLPFDIVSLSKKTALEELELRNVHMIVTIPQGFGEALQAPGAQATLMYTLNEANAQLPKGVMQSVVNRLTNELNAQASLQGTQMVMEQLHMPTQQASQTAQHILNKVVSEVTSLHPVNGLHNQMVPMMLVLGSYVGAMLMAMNLHQVSMTIGSELTKRQHLAARSLVVVIGSIIVSLVGSSIIVAFGGQMESGFFAFWLFHWLTVLTFMFFAQMLLMVVGMAGMFVNMAMLSLQLVSSGTIVPRQMLSAFYQEMARFLPATYSVEGLMNLQFGGIHTQYDVTMLLAFTFIALGVCFATTLIPGKTAVTVPAKAAA